MKAIHVPEIYVAYDRINTEEEKARLERFLEKISCNKKHTLKSEQLYEALKKERWYDKGERTGEKRQNNPNIIFTTFDWQDETNNPLKGQSYNAFTPGRFAFADFRDKKQLREERGAVCNSGYEIHTAFGCLHSCTYCHIGNALTIMLDIEKFTDKISVLMQNNPWQKLYKYDNQTDILTLEPEYGATKKLVEFFATTDKTLMLYTKSDNVNHILDLDHKGKTIVCWTMSCSEVAEKYELGAPSLEQRVEAARKCQEAGYGVRIRFSPIIPIENWKEKNAEMIEQIFTKIKPTVVSMETLCHMSGKQANALFSNLAIKTKDKITEYELFEHKDRSEIYRFFIEEIRRHDKKVKIALCLETEKMWQELKGIVNGNPDNFYCCCGAKCA